MMNRGARTFPFVRGIWLIALSALAGSACVSAYKKSVNASTEQNFRRIFFIDLNTAWQATLDALKSHVLDVSNREAGFIQTRWKDNTALKNLSESTNTTDVYIKTQYRFRVSVAKGFFDGRPSIQVGVIKEQLVQRDVLEGFRGVETDGIEERSLLYRIGRIITVRKRIEAIEEEKTRAAAESLNPGSTNANPPIPDEPLDPPDNP